MALTPLAIAATAWSLLRHTANADEDPVTTDAAEPPSSQEQPAEPAPSPVQPEAPDPGSRRRTDWATRILMVLLLGGFSALAFDFWPDTNGPSPVGPTIIGFGYSVDTPGTDGAVRILINPGAQSAPRNASGMMVVSVSLDVPAGKTVHWTVDLTGVSTQIKLDRIAPDSSQALDQRSADLIAAPTTYQMPQPINQVRDYVLVGETHGPSSGYTKLATSDFQPLDYRTASITTIAWTGPLPVAFGAAYANAVLPSLIANDTGTTSGFDFGWTPVPLHKFHAEEVLALPGDYQVDSGSQASEGLGGWKWSADGDKGITNATGFGTSVAKQAAIQRDTFLAGVFAGIAASALLTVVPLLLPLITERKAKTRDRSSGWVRAREVQPATVDEQSWSVGVEDPEPE